MNIYEELCKIVSEDQILKDEPMDKHTTFRAGGKADYLVMPSNEEQVRDLVLLLKKHFKMEERSFVNKEFVLNH